MGEEADFFHVVVELFNGQGFDDGGHLFEGFIVPLLIEQSDIELYFTVRRRGIDEEFGLSDLQSSSLAEFKCYCLL